MTQLKLPALSNIPDRYVRDSLEKLRDDLHSKTSSISDLTTQLASLSNTVGASSDPLAVLVALLSHQEMKWDTPVSGATRGKVDTCIARYANTPADTEWASSETTEDHGSVVTILEDGLYWLQVNGGGGAVSRIGISKNATVLAGSAGSIGLLADPSPRLTNTDTAAGRTGNCGTLVVLAKGDLIRAHMDTNSDTSADRCNLVVRKIL